MQTLERANEQATPCYRHAEFDYQEVTPAARSFLRSQAHRIRQRAAASIVAIGQDLLLAKRYLSHGTFRRWVVSEVGIPTRTAQDYMRVANWVKGKSATVAHLPPSVLYALSENRAPDEFATRILTRIEAGERFSRASVRRELSGFQKHAVAEMADQVASPPAAKVQCDLPEERASAALVNAVRVMLSGLPSPIFSRVRDIFTKKEILASSDLPQSILSAFSALDHDNAVRTS